MTEHNELLETACDVVVRLKAHNQYKRSVNLAVRALKRRAPGFEDYEYKDAIDFLCSIYDNVADIVKHYPVDQTKQGLYAKYEDIDFALCMKNLDKLRPGYAFEQKRGILGWAIYWHYLR